MPATTLAIRLKHLLLSPALALLCVGIVWGEQPPRPKPRAAQPAWPATADEQQVTICLFESAGNPTKFPATLSEEAFRFTTTAVAVHRLPLKFTRGGVRETWNGPLLMRAFAKVALPTGDNELLIRSPGLTRLWIDGVIVAQTPPRHLFPDAHQPFIVYEPDLPWLRVPFVGDHEVRVKVESEGKVQTLVLESLVGSDSSRCEVGETLIAARQGEAMFTLLAPAHTAADAPRTVHLVDTEFDTYRQQLNQQLDRIDRQSLEEESAKEDAFWQERHRLATETIDGLPPVDVPQPQGAFGENNVVDRFINVSLCLKRGLTLSGKTKTQSSLGVPPKGQTPFETKPSLVTADVDAPNMDQAASDLEFLRRLTLDTVGVPPSINEIDSYLAAGSDSLPNDAQHATSRSQQRRTVAITRLLADERWADHWVSYWQDVLAENPNILKPKLNNTGPFRWWLHDSLVLNKPMDRFATELIRMEGSPYAGAAAGFSWATENDLPMAEKAHIIAGAFLSIDMKCARCHDAPYHPWSQKDLFSIGAMLENKAIKVPDTSSVPKAFFDRKGDDSPIAVTLQPGDIVDPVWPADSLDRDVVSIDNRQAHDPLSSTFLMAFGRDAMDARLLGRKASSREELAALVTRAENRRFAATLVNRLWTRLLGWGLVDDTDDWFEAEVRYPELLDYLSRELVTSGYDFKHVAKLILSSRAYQRRAIDETEVPRELALTAPWRHRLSAEQVVDSLHSVAGVAMETEAITFDPEASQKIQNFLNLGEASRAWQLTSLSNERDRPSLSLPKAATIVECLEAFGWRQSRQSPLTHREYEANMVQPGVVANGTLTGSITRLTDRSTATELAIASDSPEQFVEQLFLAVLTREPSPTEQTTFVSQLHAGFQNRVQEPPRTEKPPPVSRGFATWSNHFAVEANSLMRDIELEVAAGPDPTQRLAVDWRERAEDAIWALVNSPEFQFVP